ncbi:hypothetical protein [Tunicatimonas pelagia]|uniref:hypothetical protein n=1 Tax=Tunicatimonas pelagia TaxID=931531 RepID=UPI002666F39E|nr:hypothetical protein [Tunicatimonas pelagia]WKN44631.1 hypothetical protein P0M28_06595 [Tunicatimonas pelagia]
MIYLLPFWQYFLANLPVKQLILGFTLLISCPLSALAQFEHPRSIVTQSQMKIIRERLSNEPYQTMIANVIRTGEQHLSESKEKQSYDPYQESDRLGVWAYLYLFTEELRWADLAWQATEKILADTVYLKNPLAKGLTRARLLQKLAYAYDFCYSAWSEPQRQLVNDALFEVLYSVHTTMGYAANYNIESNWMGVRYGSVILASRVWDWTDTINYTRSPVLPLQWDATKRLQDHIQANVYPSGWNVESMSYHIYNWTFVGPALITLQNQLRSFSVLDYVPNTEHSLQALMSSVVSIKNRYNRGYTADLSDDDMMFSTGGVLAMGFSLFPDEQQSALKWMHDYLIEPENYQASDGQLMYSLLFYPSDITAQNPASLHWNTFVGEETGVAIFRNRFQDENDIVATYHAKANRIRGHQGPDTNTIRLLGLGVPWIIGGGRTGLTAGQSNLFPSETETAKKDDKGLGELRDYSFFNEGSGGYVFGSGSAIGTRDHRRRFYVNFDHPSAEAVFVVQDSSANGRRWRINTPEFNQFSAAEDGYTLTAPNGSSLKFTVLNANKPIKLDTGKVPYGGKTKQHNFGIIYQGKSYPFSRYIDVLCDQNITVVMTLQPKGKTHPKVISKDEEIWVGEKAVSDD